MEIVKMWLFGICDVTLLKFEPYFVEFKNEMDGQNC